MKKKTIILVDGENISAKNADRIISKGNCLGFVAERKVYHHQKDPSTRAWTEKSKGGDYKDIQLYGHPAKDKVDRKMQKDARRYMKDPDVAMVCVVTSDGGFRCLAEDAATAGKKLCFIGGKNPSRRLRNSDAQFMKLG
jgi:hypothetical protein